MKEKLNRYLRWLWQGFMQILRLYPIELLLVVYGCVGCILVYETDIEDFMPKLALVPLFFILALVVNILAGRGPWRRVYWVSWMPIIPMSLWSGLEQWLGSEAGMLTWGVLAPLALFMCTRALRNERFVSDMMLWLRAWILALFFANVALGLFGAILYSTTYIFGLHGSWITHVWVNALILTETFAVPVLFLMMADRWRTAEFTGNRILEVLLNYIATPALLIYTGILYLYMGKILFTWTLPEGGVAYLVFGFTIFAILVRAMQFLLQKRMYDWFFNWFSLIALPTQLLFWIGVLQRTSEYGLTVPRVYLLVCGGLMTFCLLTFLSQRVGRYLYVCLTAFVVFGALAYIPGLEPERIAVRSQTARAVRAARALDRLDGNGRVLLHPFVEADTVRMNEYRKLYEALEYIRWRDTVRFASFDVELYQISELVPQPLRRYVKWGGAYDYELDYATAISEPRTFYYRIPDNASFDLDPRYKTYYTNISRYGHRRIYAFANDSIHIYAGQQTPVYSVIADKVLEQLFNNSGFDIRENFEPTENQLLQLMDYRDRDCRLIFRKIEVELTDSTTVLSDIIIDAIMLK